MNKEELKEKLLNLNVCVNNDYLDKYCDLIINNIETKYQKGKTQKHHIVPIVYYKIKYNCSNRQEAIKMSVNDFNFIVNLSFSDHTLAHLYLSYCAISDIMKYKLLCSVYRVIRFYKHIDIDSYEEFIQDNKQTLQRYYEDSKHVTYIKEDTPDKISKSLLGRVSICKNGKFKYVSVNELDWHLNNGWKKEHNKQTEDSKKRISQAHTGRKHISKDGKVKCVSIDCLDKYLESGWTLGDINRKSVKSPTLNRIAIHKDNICKYVSKDVLDTYISDGWLLGTGKTNTGPDKGKSLSESHYKKLIECNGIRNKVAVHKDKTIKYINKDDVEYYIRNGYKLGTGTKNYSVKNKIWIHNDSIEKYTSKNELEDYLSDGWKLGRKRRTKNG